MKKFMLYVLSLMSVVSNVSLVLFLGELVDYAMNQEGEVKTIMLWIVLSMVIYSVTTYSSGLLIRYMRVDLKNQFSIKLYRNVLEQDNKYFKDNNSGVIGNKILTDGGQHATYKGLTRTINAINIINLSIATSVIIYLNYIVGISVIILYIISSYIMTLFSKDLQSSEKEVMSASAKGRSVINESVAGIDTIKSFKASNFFNVEKFIPSMDELTKKQKYSAKVWLRYYFINILVLFLLPMVVLVFGLYLISIDKIELSTLIVIYALSSFIREPLSQVAHVLQNMSLAKASKERVSDILEVKSKEEINEDNTENFNFKVDISQIEILGKVIDYNFSETFELGKIYCIKGDSGRGKSVLCKTIAGFNSSYVGNISIDTSKNIDSKAFLNNNLKYLPQKPFLFEGTLLENLLLGQDINKDVVNEMNSIACLDKFIDKNSLCYKIEEAHKNISGGEAQRICLSRILLSDPNVIILDEATSALDKETEEQVLKSLIKHVRENNKILIFISHNNSTDKFSDKVITI